MNNLRGATDMVRRYLSIAMIVLLVVCWSVPSFAYEATPSNLEELSMEDYLKNYKKIPLSLDNPGLGVVPDASVHTSSDSDIWIGDDGLLVADSDDRLLSDDSFQTFAFSPLNVDVYADVNRRSDNKWLRVEKASWRVSGDAYIFTFPNINTQTERYGNIQFEIRKSMLPKPGKYGLEFTFKEGHLGTPGTGTAYTRIVSSGTNISPSHSQVKSSLEVSGTKYFVRSNVTIGYDTTGLSVFVTWPTSWNVSIQDCALFEDCFKFTFLEQAGAPSVSAPDVSSGSAADYAANQAGQIAQNTAAMQDTLKEIVQTISKQLEALWNQQYNYIHLEDMANADKNADKIVNSISDNISDQMINDDVNTDTIVNGFDNSAMDSTNNQLSSKLDEQAAQEQQILNQISAPLSSFEFSNPVTEYLSTFMLFGDFLQSLFVNSGGFKNVINLSFIMGIALMVAGLYRFKGGN